MSDTHTYSSDVAFTPAVKAIQTKKGSREGYAEVERSGGWRTEVDERLAALSRRHQQLLHGNRNRRWTTLYPAPWRTEGLRQGAGQERTIAFADYAGNRQYLTQGNLSENPKAHIFIMDYAHRRRVKIWGEAQVVDDDPALLQSLMPKGYRARPEQVILFRITAWDTNCPQHIPQKFDAADVAAAMGEAATKIAALEAEVAKLKAQVATEQRSVGRVTKRNPPSRADKELAGYGAWRLTRPYEMGRLTPLPAPSPTRSPDNTAASCGRHRR